MLKKRKITMNLKSRLCTRFGVILLGFIFTMEAIYFYVSSSVDVNFALSDSTANLTVSHCHGNNTKSEFQQGTVPSEDMLLDITQGPDVEYNFSNLNMRPIPFLSQYKNPCWFEALPKKDILYKDNLYPLLFSYLRNTFQSLREMMLKRLYSGQKWRLRCIPYFYLIGVSKSGTSDLYDAISLHQKVVVPYRKEPTYFNRIRWNATQYMVTSSLHSIHLPHPVPRPLYHYVEMYDYQAEKIRSRDPVLSKQNGCHWQHDVITGDGTPNYLWDFDGWTQVPGNQGLTEPKIITAHFINMLNPAAKLIVILRNPVDRCWSEYRAFHVKDENAKSAVEFHDLVTKGIQLMTQCLSMRTVRSCLYDKELNGQTQPVRLRAGIYLPYIKDWHKVFPRHQMFITTMEGYSAHRANVTNQIFTFLGLEPLSLEILDRKKVKHKTSAGASLSNMLDKTRTVLQDFYRPWNEKLAEYLQDDRYLWQN